MKFKYYPNRDKGDIYRDTLVDNGYEITTRVDITDFLLIDYEGRSPTDIAVAKKRHIPVFIYPHAAMTFLAWDGMYPVETDIATNFVPSFGARTVMWSYKYPCPIRISGWPWGPVQNFQEPKFLREMNINILFAPIHSIKESRKRFAANYWDDRLLSNRKAFDVLHNFPNSKLTVYMSEQAEDNFIPMESDVVYLASDLSIKNSVKIIGSQKYDLVVAFDTFAWISVAMGKPTIMFGQDIPWTGVLGRALHWEDYKDRIQYPYELLSNNSISSEKWLDDHIYDVIYSDAGIRKWKAEFIGPSFSKDSFLFEVKRVLDNYSGVM